MGISRFCAQMSAKLPASRVCHSLKRDCLERLGVITAINITRGSNALADIRALIWLIPYLAHCTSASIKPFRSARRRLPMIISRDGEPRGNCIYCLNGQKKLTASRRRSTKTIRSMKAVGSHFRPAIRRPIGPSRIVGSRAVSNANPRSALEQQRLRVLDHLFETTQELHRFTAVNQPVIVA
jgi:hypothetical protein